MANLGQKIIVAIVFLVLVGFNSYFILGQEDNHASKQPSTTLRMNSYIPVQADDDDKDEAEDEDLSIEELQTIKGRLTEEQAKTIALETIGSGSVIDFEAEREDGRLVYGITLRAQGDMVEVEIDGQTGEVLEIEWGEDDKDEDD